MHPALGCRIYLVVGYAKENWQCKSVSRYPLWRCFRLPAGPLSLLNWPRRRGSAGWPPFWRAWKRETSARLPTSVPATRSTICRSPMAQDWERQASWALGCPRNNPAHRSMEKPEQQVLGYRNEHNRKIKDVKTETQATVRLRAASRGNRVARDWPRSVGSTILGQSSHISLDSIEAW